MTQAQPIGAVLDATVTTDPSRPLLTYYDHQAGDRVELSAATLRNWVDKTANLLVDVVGAGAGSRVGIDLPAHWQAVVWLLACWRVGAVVTSVDGVDVAVVGPDPLMTASWPDAPEVVATALHPLGARFEEPLPVGVLDYGAEVFAQGDTFSPGVPVAAGLPGWDRGSDLLDQAALLAAGTTRWVELGLTTGGRLLTATDPMTLVGIAEVVLGPLLVDGSVVLVRNPDPAQCAELISTERVDVSAVGASAAL